ncbi:tbc1 domain family member related [Stylonychia lemnae]|uniref:Tbc1 domain family member related n=1 Tax=Stylonychia lemnae TaxID=5949 RepID=A0A078A7A4_STYLE|nr:tbc1 domain family member related [Stylonychia lemnae]|eukprot:CDW77412.1 tbc1 domain family member related [Stylonychia lemnae]
MEQKAQTSFHFPPQSQNSTSSGFGNQPNQNNYLRNVSPRTNQQNKLKNVYSSGNHTYQPQIQGKTKTHSSSYHNNNHNQKSTPSNSSLQNSNLGSSRITHRHTSNSQVQQDFDLSPRALNKNKLSSNNKSQLDQQANLQLKNQQNLQKQQQQHSVSIQLNNSQQLAQQIQLQQQQKLEESFDQSQAIRMRNKLETLVSQYEIERMFCDQIPLDDNIIKSTVCDLENQRVIRADADRSRGSENLNKDNIELMLTLYCKRNSIRYKQGMNEQQCGFQLNFSYNCFSAFIWRYLTTFYQDEEFLTLQAALQFLQLLFKYHDPELVNYLEVNQVTPEIKFEIDVIVEFWDMILEEDDQFFIFFFSVSLLIHNKIVRTISLIKQIILDCEQSHLPSVMSKMTINSIDELRQIWQKAQQLQDSTPYSFKELPEIKQIFQSDIKQMEKDAVAQFLEKIENIPCLPILPEELFFYAYPDILQCSNPKCQNSLNGFKMNQSMLSGLQSPTMKDHDLMSPVREMSMKNPVQDDSYQVQYQYQQRRMTAADMTNKQQLQLLQQRKANIHDIIKKEINHKQQQQLNTRMTSNQTSPIKGQISHLQINEQEYYKGIDISSSRSPFKNMNKQSPAKADGMPLETDSNVYDDNQEQQESHIDLINETTRMKHLSQAEEQRQMMLRRANHNVNTTVMTVQEPRIGSSPKAHLSTYIGNQQNNQSLILSSQNSFQNTVKLPNLQRASMKHNSYGRGLSASACKVSKQNAPSSNGGGSIIEQKRISVLQPSLLQSGLQTLNVSRLEYCRKCLKKREYEDRQQFMDNQESEFSISIQETQQNQEEESHEFYYEKIRFLIVDCRLEALQKEALLPNSFQLSIQTELGLEPLQSKQKKVETNNENFFDIKAYHESILRFLIEDFQLKGFKYISVIPGGFKECHEISQQYNFQILNHEKNKCFHCDSKTDKLQYEQKYNINGFSDIFNGFKHWYDVANTKIKSFVKGPIKMLGNNQSGNSQQNVNQKQNNGPHKQSKHQHKTTEDQSKLPGISNQNDQETNFHVTTTSNNMILTSQGQDSEKQPEITLGSLPISFVSQSSRQELFNQLQGSQCSSNVSVNSSHTADGNNLRDAISNKKIMSYKLMSKVPGDRSEIIYTQANLDDIQLLQKAANQIQNTQVQYLVSDQKSNQINILNPQISQQTQEIQIMISPPNEKQPQDKEEEEEKLQSAMKDINDQNIIKIELISSGQAQIQPAKNSNIQQKDGNENQNSNKMNRPPSKEKNQEQQIQNQPNAQISQQQQQQQINPYLLNKIDYYTLNGVTKFYEVTKHEFEMINTKKTSIIYQCIKQFLKKKQEPPTKDDMQQQYPVQLIITPYTVSVIRESFRVRSNRNSGLVNQSIESSLSQIEEWDQADFDELHPQLLDHQDSKRNKMLKQGQNVGPFAILESRFLMYDLIKITSRKSSSKTITFYFRIPMLEEYDIDSLENGIVQQLDQKPTISYQFAFKRKNNFKEVSMSFQFDKEDDAKQCIANVSTIYKKLKNSKSSKKDKKGDEKQT